MRPVGARVGASVPICLLHARDAAAWEAASTEIREAVRIGAEAPPPMPVIRKRLST